MADERFNSQVYVLDSRIHGMFRAVLRPACLGTDRPVDSCGAL